MSGQDHGHDHEHGPVLAYDDDSVHDVNEAGHYQMLAEVLRALVVEKGLVKATDIREHLQAMDSQDLTLGPRIIAHAWADPDFKARLLADGSKAVAEFGVDMGETELVVVENTDDIHNVVVCTLCSCYPRMILGLPPDWYKSKSYRARTVREPRAVLSEFGTELPADTTLRVHDSNADMRYLVLPARPAGTEDWDEARLAGIVTRDHMIGVALPATQTH